MKVALASWGMDDYWGSLSLGLSDLCDLHIITSELHREEGYSEDFDVVKRETEAKLHYVGNKGFSKNLFAPFKLMNILKEIEPDIIHLPGGKPSAVPLLYPIINKFAPLVVTIHDPCNFYDKTPLQKKLRLNMGYESSNRIIVPNKTVKKYILQIKGSKLYEKISIVPHPSFETKIKSCRYKEGEKENLENLILFFGQIRRVKGLDVLIKAEPFIRQEIEDFKIIIAGSGDFQKYGKMIENPDNFEIHNRYLNNQEAGKLFKKADVVVLPYLRHPFRGQSGVVSTALAFNLPVITTETPHAEVIEHQKTGYIVPPEKPKKLARAITRYLENGSIKEKMKKNIRKKVKEKLSPAKIAEETFKVYQSVIS